MTERMWQLRAMSVAALLDATIRLYRRNFLTFVAIVAVMQVPLYVINGLLAIPMSQATEEMMALDAYDIDPELYDPDSLALPLPSGFGRYFLWLGVQLLISGTLGLVVTTLMTGALAWAVSERHLQRPITVGGAYRAVRRRWQSLLGAALLTIAIYLGLYLLVFVPCIGQIAGIPLLIFVYLCLRFVPQVVMIEGQTAGDSLRRSWFLAKPHIWRVLGIVALLYILGLLVTAGPSYLVAYGLAALQPSLVVQSVISTAISALLGVIYLPIRLTGETVLYYDLRVRSEGLDLEMEAEALARPDDREEALFPDLDFEPGQPPLPAPPPAAGPLLTRRDWRNLAILLGVGLGVLALCCAAYAGLVALVMGPLSANLESIIESLPTMTPLP